MEKQQAESLASVLETYSHRPLGEYEIKRLESDGPLRGFHQWVDGKPLVAAFQVTKLGEEGYYYLLIDWHRKGNYYLVLFLSDRSSTAAEIHRTEEVPNGVRLIWKYTPLKRDGKNDQRKAYFQKAFGTTVVEIPLPQTAETVEAFFQCTFSLSRNRLRADRIVDVLSM